MTVDASVSSNADEPTMKLRSSATGGFRNHLVHSIRADRPVAIIGDVHGQADLLERMLHVTAARGMELMFVGDLVDRGPNPQRVIDLLSRERIRGVRGNHEEWFCGWLAGEGFDRVALHPAMGGAATLRSYGLDPWALSELEVGMSAVPDAHRDFLLSLPLAIDLEVDGERWWLLHAGIPGEDKFFDMFDQANPQERPPGGSPDEVPWLARHRRTTLLWTKTMPAVMPHADRPVVFGHIPHDRVNDVGHAVCVDTGAGTALDGALSALVLPSREVIRLEPR
jgi:Calcineurin-like phosphoesterase